MPTVSIVNIIPRPIKIAETVAIVASFAKVRLDFDVVIWKEFPDQIISDAIIDTIYSKNTTSTKFR